MPMFVLRADMRVAPAALRDYAQRLKNIGGTEEEFREAIDCAVDMEKWQVINGIK